MKLKSFLLALFLAAAFTSCKKDEKSASEQTATEQKVADDNTFTLTLNATVRKNDSFQVYYKEDNDMTTPFEEKNSLYVEFKGSENPQDIVFALPKDVMPTMLRFDFGVNKEQSEIIVNSFKMKFNSKNFSANGADFFKYFYANEKTIKVDIAKSSATPIVPENGVYDPMFTSQPILNTEIAKLLG